MLFFFQAEDGIRDVERSRGLGDVYKRQSLTTRVSNPRMKDKARDLKEMVMAKMKEKNK